MTSGVYVKTEEHKRKISEAKKGRKLPLFTEEHKMKISNALKGKPKSEEHKRRIKEKRKCQIFTEETRRKMSESMMGKKNHNWGNHYSEEIKQKMRNPKSEEHKRKLSEANKGKHLTEETRRRMSKSHEGKSCWNKGLTKENNASLRKISEARTLLIREKSSNWLGGKSFEPYGLEFNKILKENIRNRDNHRCQLCGKHQDENFTKSGKKKKLIAHHVDYDKQNNKPENLISLCNSCHMKTNFSRKDWTEYFRKQMLNRG